MKTNLLKTSIQDERGYNQIFLDSLAARIRKERRCDYMISKMDKLTTDSNILEIGCGDGAGLKYIADKTKANCLGIDLSKAFIDTANQKYKADKLVYEVADFNDPQSFKGTMQYGKFDYVVGNGILHHLYYNLDNSLVNLHKLLNNKGKIIFIEPNIYNPYIAIIFKIPYFRKKAFLEPDEMAFSEGFIKEKILKAGFSNCKTEVKDFLLPNVPDSLINTFIKVGNVLEKTPLTYIAQSIFVVGGK